MNTIMKLLPFLLIFIFNGLNSVVYAEDNCNLDLPNPVLVFTGTENYEVNGKQFTRYRFNITNFNSFPEELFRTAPDLPPCGLNTNSSRTWVDMFESGNQVYGFCALSEPDQLNSIWFAKLREDSMPESAHVQFNDRGCAKVYFSNSIRFDSSSDDNTQKILIDSSRDGGTWWFPQGVVFNSSQPHQGKALADYLRSLGYDVTELPRPTVITANLLKPFAMVIRAGGSGEGYSSSEIAAYKAYLISGGKLILLSDFLRPGTRDSLAHSFGIFFKGVSQGENIVDSFEVHPITKGVTRLNYGVGSGFTIFSSSANPLAYLSDGTYLDLNANNIQDEEEPTSAAVMGEMEFGLGQIVFFGDVNTWLDVPQPLVDNTLNWLLPPSLLTLSLPIFDFSNDNLHIPSVHVPGVGLFEVNLSRLTEMSEPLQFILRGAVITSRAAVPPTIYSISSGLLHIPNLQVPNDRNGINVYKVDLQHITESDPLQFFLTNVTEVHNSDTLEILGIYRGTAINTIYNCTTSFNNRTTTSTGSIEITNIQSDDTFSGSGAFSSKVSGFVVEEKFAITGQILPGDKLTGRANSSAFIDGEPAGSETSSFIGQISGDEITIKFPEQNIGVDNCKNSGTSITVLKQF